MVFNFLCDAVCPKWCKIESRSQLIADRKSVCAKLMTLNGQNAHVANCLFVWSQYVSYTNLQVMFCFSI